MAILYCVFESCRFENQRWVRARATGFRGSSEVLGEIVDWTRIGAFAFTIGFLVAYAYAAGWKAAAGLFVISWGMSWLYALVSTMLLRGESPVVWMFSTVALWPLMLLLGWVLSRIW